ncbi:Hypothetical_protein [Hexamita inflata]|uniref:Hypothetical_protein n=1 Tax=Hexamita inflata TaxID=28002 RepID=A0AA86U0D1_9EUKA|nr:Hypothetical protein HINF_LOCUS21362 [Hexamita inflata]
MNQIYARNSQLIGFSFQCNQQNGNFVAQLQYNIQVTVLNLQICTNINNSNIELNSLFSCENICENGLISIYGLCLKQLLNGQKVENGTEICIFPFNFEGNSCVCERDYVQNGTVCVQIIKQLDILEEYIEKNISNIKTILTKRIVNVQNEVEQKIIELDTRMYSNVSQLLQIIQQQNETTNEQLKLLKISISQVNDSGNTLFNQLQSDFQSVNATLSAQMNSNRNEIIQINSSFNTFAALAIKNNTEQNNAINSFSITLQNLQAQVNALKGQNVYLSSQYDDCGQIVSVCANGICGSFRSVSNCNIGV